MSFVKKPDIPLIHNMHVPSEYRYLWLWFNHEKKPVGFHFALDMDEMKLLQEEHPNGIAIKFQDPPVHKERKPEAWKQERPEWTFWRRSL